jgi:stearoyl-CoA 9-desaturase NADPH oxidoreductase
MWSRSEPHARVVGLRRETSDTTTLLLQPGRSHPVHQAGQFVGIGTRIDGVWHWRTYSVTSAPGDRHLAVTVTALPGGTVSGALAHRTPVGALLRIGPPAGEFVLPRPAPEKLLFLTAGSGITPVMGMLRNLTDAEVDIVLVHSAPTAADVIFGDELRTLARRGRIRLVERYTDIDGMLDVARLDDIVGDIADRQTWACGPIGLLHAVERRWEADGLADRLHTERFRPSVLVTGDGGTVTFAKTGTAVVAEGSRTLLDAGEAAGVLMPSGCRMGICYGCVAPLRQGSVRDLRTGEITTAAEGDGIQIQTCISGAAGNCDIEL